MRPRAGADAPHDDIPGQQRGAGSNAHLGGLGLVAGIRLRLNGASAWLAVGEAFNRGGRFLLLLLLAREVGAETYGAWVIAIATATILAAAGDAGLGTIVTRDIASDKALTRKYLANVWALVPILAVVGFGLLLAAVLVAPGGTPRLLLLVVGVSGVLESGAYLLLSPLRAHGRFLPEGLVRAFQGTALLLAGGAVVLVSQGQAEALAPVFPAVATVAVLIGAIAVWRSFGAVRPQIDVNLLRQLAGSALPVFASTVVFFVYFRIDVYLLGFLKGEEAIGLYGAAYNLAFGAAFLPLMLGRTALPRFAASESVAALRSTYFRNVAITALLAAGLSALLVAAAPFIVNLYGSDFAGARVPFLILIVAQALFFFTHLNYMIIIARHRAGTALALTGFALCVNLAANFLLIPMFAASGAAFAMIISEGTLLAAQALIIRDFLRPSTVGIQAPAPNDEEADLPKQRAA